MCLAVFALDVHPRFPLVVAANRDEHFDRPAAPLGWWRAGDGQADILSGRDLQAGGTWLGLNRRGRFALLTNIRARQAFRADAPSRGALVVDWLDGTEGADGFADSVGRRPYNGFNLVAASVADRRWHWIDSTGRRQALGDGLHGLSNGTLDEAWPKVERLKAATAAGIDAATDADDLADWLLRALRHDTIDPDDRLPSTGVPLEVERWLSPAFIRSPDGRYGTRCSTLVITEQRGADRVTHVLERTYEADPSRSTLRQERLSGWPAA